MLLTNITHTKKQFRFLSCLLFLLRTRYLTPERHFQEWVGFLVLGVIAVAILGPKVAPNYAPSTSTARNDLAPRLWMKGSSLLLYPYVAYTKISWQGSNYPGRWLMFVCMPVGTLWILSALFCGSGISLNQNYCGKDKDNLRRYKVRYWLLETWISFLPLILDLIPALFGGAVSSTWQYASGKAPRGGHDGENAAIAYFCHCLYLVLAPVYYFWNGELLSLTHKARNNDGRIGTTLVVDCVLKQVVGTSICAIYYMGIVTPAAIMAGLNVNFLLEGTDNGADGSNFRIYCMVRWFCHGCAIRVLLGAAKRTGEMIQARARRDGTGNGNGDGDLDMESGNNNKRQ